MGLPLWKWASIVEHWIWMHTDEAKHPALQAELQQGIQWTWIGDDAGVRDLIGKAPPVNWQENKAGEVLLSRHRKRRGVVTGGG